MLHLEAVFKDYLAPYLSKAWEAHSRIENTTFGKIDSKFPFVTEEAAFNTVLSGCIHRYMVDRNDYLSFVINEAGVFRKKSGDSLTARPNGRCDIIWYVDCDVYYVELKGSFYAYKTPHENVVKAVDYIGRIAKNQVLSIFKDENSNPLEGRDQIITEKWYRYKPQNRYISYMGMLYSTVHEGKSTFKELTDGLEKKGQGLKILHERHFKDGPFAIITDGEKEYVSDGYILIGDIEPL